MKPRSNRKNVRDPACAQKGEVPKDIVGRRYDSFTEDERNYVQTYREIHRLCSSCGAEDHVAAKFPRPDPSTPTPTEKSQSSSHVALVHRPKSQPKNKTRANKPRHEAAVAKAFEVPAELIGKTYRNMTKEERDQIYEYRIARKLCTYCGSKEHKKFSCPTREDMIQSKLRVKIARVKSGEIVIQTELTGPFSGLPTELRLQIFEEALEKDEIVVFRRGMLKGICLVPGLHIEAILSFFKVNEFNIPDLAASNAFSRMITTFNAGNQIRSLYFSHYTRDVSDSWRGSQIFTDLEIIEKCTKLEKLKVAVYAGAVCYRPQQDQECNLPNEADWTAENYQFTKFFGWPSLKSLYVVGIDERWYADWCDKDSMLGVLHLVKWLRAEYKARGKDVVVETNEWVLKAARHDQTKENGLM